MTSRPSVASLGRITAVTGLLATAIACAPSSQKPADAQGTLTSAVPTSTPVLLSCPAGQQPLMRQVLVNGAAVPQVECVTAGAPSMATAAAALAPAVGFAAQPSYPVAAPAYPVAAAPVVYQEAPVATRVRTTTARPVARRAVYQDDVVEYRRPSRRSWQKSAVIIGSAAGAGAGVGALTGGKKGALIGAAIGGGGAAVWDQVTRRQPR